MLHYYCFDACLYCLLQKIKSVSWFTVPLETFRANFPRTLEWQRVNHKEILEQKCLRPPCAHTDIDALSSTSEDDFVSSFFSFWVHTMTYNPMQDEI